MEILTVSDAMQPVPPPLKQAASLDTIIDKMAAHDREALPVVDDDGTYRGTVTARETEQSARDNTLEATAGDLAAACPRSVPDVPAHSPRHSRRLRGQRSARSFRGRQASHWMAEPSRHPPRIQRAATRGSGEGRRGHARTWPSSTQPSPRLNPCTAGDRRPRRLQGHRSREPPATGLRWARRLCKSTGHLHHICSRFGVPARRSPSNPARCSPPETVSP